MPFLHLLIIPTNLLCLWAQFLRLGLCPGKSEVLCQEVEWENELSFFQINL